MSELTSVNTDRESLGLIVELSQTVFSADGCAFYVLAGNAMHRVHGGGMGDQIDKLFLRGSDVVGRVWASNEPLLVKQYANWSERTMQTPIADVAAVPVRVEGTVAGVLLVLYRQAVQFSPAQLGQLERIALLLASTLEIGFLRGQYIKQQQARAKDKVALSEYDQKLNLFESAVQNASESVCITEVSQPDDGNEEHARTVFVNSAFHQLLGYTPQDMLAQPVSLLRSSYFGGEQHQHINQRLKLGHSVELETIEYRKDGSPLWVQLSIVPIFNEQHVVTHRVSWRRDITERKHAQMIEAYRNRILELALRDVPMVETLQTTTALLERVFMGASAGVFLRRHDRLLLVAAPNWRPIVRSLLDGVPVAMGHGSAAYATLEATPAAVENIQDDPRWSSMDRAMLMSGVISAWAAPIMTADGKVLGAIELHFTRQSSPSPTQFDHLENISRLATLVIERSNLLDRLSDQASTDKLTGLPNRFGVERFLEQALQTARQRNSRLAVLQMDLDGFRRINDTLGHEVGDEILRTITDRWRTKLRSQDMLARPGGDEFTLVVNSLEGAIEAEALARELLQALRYPIQIRGVELFLNASIGAAVYPEDGNSANILLRNADTAMNIVKRLGVSAYKRFEPDMNKASKERLELEIDLRRALERNEFVVRYQPQVNSLGQVVFVEALLYWQHPREGVISPGRFLPTALESGLIVPMGEWILRQACKEIGAWRRDGFNVGLAVNVDVQQLMRPDFAQTVARVLAETGFDVRAIELEVTESALMNDAKLASERLEALRSLGVHTAIDDFGTGYSSLSYLGKLPVDYLKVDRSFVSNLTPDDAGWNMVKLIVMLARQVGMGVVIEGVETKAQFEAVKAFGIDRAQGYYFSKPVVASDLLGRIRAKR